MIVLALLWVGCTTSPTHPDLRRSRLPKLIPIKTFFYEIESNYEYRVAPNGKRIAWINNERSKLSINFRDIDGKKITKIPIQTNWKISDINWARDSRRLICLQKTEGQEYHIYIVDLEHPEKNPVDLTPLPCRFSKIHRIIRSDPKHILIYQDRRCKKCWDLYKVNILTGKQTLIGKNPGHVQHWLSDRQGNLRGRILKIKPNRSKLEIFNSASQNWVPILNWDNEDKVDFLGFTLDGRNLYLLSNLNRERVSLVLFNLGNKKETIIFDDPQMDLEKVYLSSHTGKPLLAITYPDFQKIYFLDPKLKNDFIEFVQDDINLIVPTSIDDERKLITFKVITDKYLKYYLHNRKTRKNILLSTHPIYAYTSILSDTKPISFKSRDGLTLHGYLTFPYGTNGKHLPMVVLIHGGPWYRDYWGYDSMVQFLANRGYVVLQINFRGSTGYGRSFKQAAIGELAGKMHTDLIDGINWTIQKEIADPDKIGIMGASYGGYATIVGLSFTPDVFACGINISGISNLVSHLEAWQDPWEPNLGLWLKYVGNPNNLEERKRMKAKSPLFLADRITKPLLIIHGAKDYVVNKEESDQMVSALRKSDKKVDYLVFPNEGHDINDLKNRLKYYHKIERFFSKHLGGRCGGKIYY